MHLNIKPYLVMITLLVFCFSLIAFLRNTRYDYVPAHWMAKNEAAMRVVVFCAFILFGMLAVPVAIKTFLAIQVKIGNGDHRLVQTLSTYAKEIVYGVWIFYMIGICIAVPLMIKYDFFSTATTSQ